MNTESNPTVVSLLSASKNVDHKRLRIIMNDIQLNGIPSDKLNAVDSNGRTALSYLCGHVSDNDDSSLITLKYLNCLLNVSTIDVNKADNDGNTPLHFAAEAGLPRVIQLIARYSICIDIDAKNIFGMTPLMKAALKGQIKCGKLLLAAGASPFITDTRRGFLPSQLARLCGYRFCADSLEALIVSKQRQKIKRMAVPWYSFYSVQIKSNQIKQQIALFAIDGKFKEDSQVVNSIPKIVIRIDEEIRCDFEFKLENVTPSKKK